MKNLLAKLLIFSCLVASQSFGDLSHDNQPEVADWIAYGTFQADPWNYIDNPDTNILGLSGEVTLPFTVPHGYELVIDYLQIEGPAFPQVGMALWLGDYPCLNSKCIISCTTAGGSTQLIGMLICIPEGKIVNIRVMNNTALPWVNGFYLQGVLRKL